MSLLGGRAQLTLEALPPALLFIGEVLAGVLAVHRVHRRPGFKYSQVVNVTLQRATKRVFDIVYIVYISKF